MYSIIRNGQYLCSENILLGDVEVPVRPHENAILINGSWVIDADSYFSKKDNEAAKELLEKTEFDINRHKEELELGIETSLTSEDYLDLVKQRLEARKKVTND